VTGCGANTAPGAVCTATGCATNYVASAALITGTVTCSSGTSYTGSFSGCALRTTTKTTTTTTPTTTVTQAGTTAGTASVVVSALLTNTSYFCIFTSGVTEVVSASEAQADITAGLALSCQTVTPSSRRVSNTTITFTGLAAGTEYYVAGVGCPHPPFASNCAVVYAQPTKTSGVSPQQAAQQQKLALGLGLGLGLGIPVLLVVIFLVVRSRRDSQSKDMELH